MTFRIKNYTLYKYRSCVYANVGWTQSVPLHFSLSPSPCVFVHKQQVQLCTMVYVCTTAEYNRLLHSVYTIASRSVICTVPYQANSVVVILVCLITQVKQRLGRLVLEWVSIFTSLVRIQLNFILLRFCNLY